MKPIGLEGKVGAPAIVKKNPLLRVYDEEFVPEFWRESSEYKNLTLRRILRSVECSWDDALGVVQDRYPDRPAELCDFLHCVSWYVPDRVLRYDLDTPEFDLRIGTYERRRRAVIVDGTCHRIVLSPNVCGIIRGHVGTLELRSSLAVVQESVDMIGTLNGGLVAVSPDVDIKWYHRWWPADPPNGRRPSRTELIVVYATLPTMLVTTQYNPFSLVPIHDADLCRRWLALADDPVALLERSPALRRHSLRYASDERLVPEPARLFS